MIPIYKKRLFIHPESPGYWDRMLTSAATAFLRESLDRGEGRSISALARALGVTRERVGQILDALGMRGEYARARAALSSCKKVKGVQKVQVGETIKDSAKTPKNTMQELRDDDAPFAPLVG